MSQQLSSYKVSRMMSMYFSGYTQTEIARKLKVHQSAVSLYVARFRAVVEEHGLDVARKEYMSMDSVTALHNLAAELRKAGLTVEEAGLGLKVHRRLQALGVRDEDYPHLVECCNKVKTEGYLEAAIKLSKLEQSTGMTYEQIIPRFERAGQKLKETEDSLRVASDRVKVMQAEVSAMAGRKKAAGDELAAYMTKVGVDTKRLQKVEELALALKRADISNEELEGMIQRQQCLNRTGISLTNFTAILGQVTVLTAHDQGKGLLKMLADSGGLAGVVRALEAKVEKLKNQVSGLEEKAAEKRKIESDLANLRTSKTKLEKTVGKLKEESQALGRLKNEVGSLQEQRSALEGRVAELAKQKETLDQDIALRQQKISDLAELETRHQELSASIGEMQGKLDKGQWRMAVLGAFIGLINASSMDDLDTFARVLPKIIADARLKQESPKILRDYIIGKLSGGALKILRCSSCNARFATDKPSEPYFGYYCPTCGQSYPVTVLHDEAAVLQEALDGKQTVPGVRLKVTPAGKSNQADTHDNRPHREVEVLSYWEEDTEVNRGH